MATTYQILYDLKGALELARVDIRKALLRRPEPSDEEMSKLRTRAIRAWQALAKAEQDLPG